MWTKINDCAKQLTLHSIVRETNVHVKVYDIIEVEFDQYKLSLISIDDTPTALPLSQVLTCQQLVKYQFEVIEN